MQLDNPTQARQGAGTAKIRLTASPATSGRSSGGAAASGRYESYGKYRGGQGIGKQQTYQIWFKVHFDSKFGEEVCVFGSIPELGGWKTHKYRLKWTEGNYWVSDKPCVTESRHFCYKYRVLGPDGEPTKWEEGADRICQPELLPDGTHGQVLDKVGAATLAGGRNVAIHDDWERYSVNFQVFDPLYKPGDQMWIETSGAPEGYDFTGLQPIKMSRRTGGRNWLDGKYGEQVHLWEA